MRRNEILLKLKAQRQELIEHHGVTALFLFGSVARDEARPDSDVDILVEFKQPVGVFKFIELQERYPEIPRGKTQGIRNVLVHEYFRLDEKILWKTSQEDIPN